MHFSHLSFCIHWLLYLPESLVQRFQKSHQLTVRELFIQVICDFLIKLPVWLYYFVVYDQHLLTGLWQYLGQPWLLLLFFYHSQLSAGCDSSSRQSHIDHTHLFLSPGQLKLIVYISMAVGCTSYTNNHKHTYLCMVLWSKVKLMETASDMTLDTNAAFISVVMIAAHEWSDMCAVATGHSLH